jgi:hypothetical protein
VTFRGTVYVGGKLSGSTTYTQVIHGALILPSGSSTSTGLFEVYYDTAAALQTTTQGIYVSTWTETTPVEF